MWSKVLLSLVVAFGVFVMNAQAELVVTITSPVEGDILQPCIDLDIQVSVEATAGEEIKDVRFYTNNMSRGRDTDEPFEKTVKSIYEGNYQIRAKATDTDRNEYWAEPVNIRVGDVSRGEVLLNNSFTCGGLAPWSTTLHEGAQATFTVFDDGYFDDDHYLMVEIENGSDADWHIQLNQSCPLDSGHVYEIYFMADAETEKTIAVGMQENQDPWDTQIWQSLTIDGFNLYGPLEFTAVKSDPTNQLRLNFGGNTVACFLDAVQVIDRSATGVKSKKLDFDGNPVTNFELLQAYPNPFNMATNIPFKLSQEGFVHVDIYNIRGQKVDTLVRQKFNPGEHKIGWNGLDSSGRTVPSGIYVYRVTVDMDGQSLAMSGKVLLMK